MGIKLYYHPASGPCRSVMITARHLNIPLSLEYLDLFKGEHLTPEFLKVIFLSLKDSLLTAITLKLNPQHVVPTLVDDDFVLWECRAIMQYLVDQYQPDSSIYPKDPKKRATVNRLLYFDIGTLYKAVIEWYRPRWFLQPLDPEKKKVLQEKMELFDSMMKGKKYAAGDQLTLADFSLLPSVTQLNAFDFDLSPYKNINQWISQLKKDLPFFEELVEKPIEDIKKLLQVIEGDKK